MWYVYTVKYYSATKKNGVLLFPSVWINWSSLFQINQTQDNNTQMWKLRISQSDFKIEIIRSSEGWGELYIYQTHHKKQAYKYKTEEEGSGPS